MRDRCATLAVAVALLLGARDAAAQPRAPDAATITTWARLLSAHDARRPDTVVVDGALASSLAPLRAAAARVIALNRVAARYGVLRTRLVSERDTAAARDAAFALGLVADTASCPALRRALSRRDVAEAAAWAIGEIGDPCGAWATLFASAAPTARAALLRAAGKWTPFPAADVVQAYRTARTRDARWSALYVLGRSRQPAGGALALAASREADAGLREVAARLMTVTVQADTATHPVIAGRLVALLQDPAPHVRIAALRALATHGAARASGAFETAAGRERDANVRVAYVQALGSVADSASPLWATWWQADTSHVIRRALVTGAWQAGAIERLPGGMTLATDVDPRLRVAMLDAVPARDAARYAPQAAARLADDDPRVRAAAVRALMRTTGALRDSLRAAHAPAMLADPDARVREIARATFERGSGAPREMQAPADTTLARYVAIVQRIVVPALAGRQAEFHLGTSRGMVRIALDGVLAPMTIDHLARLADRGYFRDLSFHRVVPAFVAQTGDPRGDGSGGPGTSIRDELNRSRYRRGAVGMALSGPDTGGSQFFLTLAPQPHLDGHYTVFGQVRAGAAAADALVQGDMLHSLTFSPP